MLSNAEMKLLRFLKMFRLVLPLLVLGLVLPMIMPGPDGEPVMTWEDWLPDAVDTEGVERFMPKAPPPKIYKWQDAEGRWHFSDDPITAADAGATLAELREPNRLPPVEMPDEEGAAAPAPSTPSGPGFSPLTIPIQDVPKLMEDARNVQKLMDQRNEQIEQF